MTAVTDLSALDTEAGDEGHCDDDKQISRDGASTALTTGARDLKPTTAPRPWRVHSVQGFKYDDDGRFQNDTGTDITIEAEYACSWQITTTTRRSVMASLPLRKC